MTKFWLIISYYNEQNSINQCLWSAVNAVNPDGLILVDGAYEGYDNYADDIQNHWSTDGTNYSIYSIRNDLWAKDFKWFTKYNRSLGQETEQFITKHPNKYSEVELTGWRNEIDKRSFSIDLVPTNDYFMILDADELLIGNHKIFHKELYSPLIEQEIVRNVGIIHYPRAVDWYIFPRVYKKVPDMHYNVTHSNIFVGDKPVSWKPPTNQARVFSGCIIIHVGAFYPDMNKQKMKWNYINKRQEEEDVDKYKREQLTGHTDNDLSVIKELFQAKKDTGVFFMEHDVSENNN